MNQNKTTRTQSGETIFFEVEPFSEGSFRRCFRGFTGFGKRRSQKFVVKAMKQPNLRKNLTLMKQQLKVYEIAYDYAGRFNKILRQKGCRVRIKFVQPELVQIQNLKRTIYNFYAKSLDLGDYLCAEPFLEGKYIKFTNNTGYSDNNKFMQAFQHFTYMESRQYGICCDLQGVISGNTFILTDPAINSIHRSYGNTDMGQQGINEIMKRHTCNQVCEALGLKRNRQLNQFIQRILYPGTKRILSS